VITGVDSAACVPCGEPAWHLRGPIPWEIFAQGEYVGPHRLPHTPEYRLRVDDQLELIYRLTRDRQATPYKLNVGDRVRIESLADADLDRELEIQPDGTITLRLLGQVLAADRTTDELRRELEAKYKKYYRVPSITVTPIRVNTKLDDLRATVDARQGLGGQRQAARVAPDGTVQLPALGPVPAQGLTLVELKHEIDARYAEVVQGIEVTPVLTERAPRFIYVVGEVARPGRFDLTGPTTVTQAISLAGGWNVGANLNQIVIFRRAEDWRLLATKVDVRGALFGKRPAPSDEIWLRDSDVVIVPKTPLKSVTDAFHLIFTGGVYSVAPFLAESFYWVNNEAVVF
jgi:polysaccharide export outer membrane protein